MAASESEWRRLPVDLGIRGGGRIGLSDFDRVVAWMDGLVSRRPRLRRSSSALVGVTAIMSLKSRCGRAVGKGGKMGERRGEGSLVGDWRGAN